MLYFRNRFFAYITIVAMVLYSVIYLVMPSTVDEALRVGVFAPDVPDLLLELLNSRDITLVELESDAALQQAVSDNQYPVGLVLTADVIRGLLRGEQTTVTVYFASDAPPEISEALQTVMRLAFNEISYTLGGQSLNVTFREEIIGQDMTGQQLAVRERLLPLLAVMLLVMEMMGLGNLIAEEAENGTLRALLITPVNVPGLFTSKAIMGIVLAFVQAALLLGLTGNLTQEPLLLLLTLLLSALVVTGIAFLIASVSRDMMGVFAWSFPLIIVMLIPSYGVVFPGTLTSWSQFIPSYYMVSTIHQVVNFGASWGAVAHNLLALLIMGVVFMAAGVLVMERKVR